MKTVSTFYVENFGCRATQADGAAIERQFQERGFVRADVSTEAEFVVLNTCTVTAAADQDARAAIRRVHRKNPNAQIVVTGCYAQRAPEEIAALPGVALVIGNSHKHRLAELVTPDPPPRLPEMERAAAFPQRAAALNPSFLPISTLTSADQKSGDQIFVSDIFAHTELLAAPVFEAANERTRPNLKVQDGCGNRCSFCVIPSVRGNSRSLPRDRILEEVNALVNAGYREVVISGINLGRWGRDLAQMGDFYQPMERRASGDLSRNSSQDKFEDLVRSILEETPLEKLRISSVEPMDWSDELIHLMASSPRIAKHAHVPMQSGSDTVLRRMHRKYRPWHYREKIEKIRAAMPTAAIGADVMVGFPGESEAEFSETRRMVEDLPFTYLHVFTYSARPGTAAAVLPNQVPAAVARERNRILRELAGGKKLAFMRKFLGSPVAAITLNGHDDNHTESLTDNYLKLRLEGSHPANRWISATIKHVEDGMMVGSLTQ
ncbi:MAG TPA: MiaB/RimO family radical SAM methylthiotransferase [Terriglobales bacterium]|jgi:threonylcarbamoyladenosine tRNA methylthiotransferase MtaB